MFMVADGAASDYPLELHEGGADEAAEADEWLDDLRRLDPDNPLVRVDDAERHVLAAERALWEAQEAKSLTTRQLMLARQTQLDRAGGVTSRWPMAPDDPIRQLLDQLYAGIELHEGDVDRDPDLLDAAIRFATDTDTMGEAAQAVEAEREQRGPEPEPPDPLLPERVKTYIRDYRNQHHRYPSMEEATDENSNVPLRVFCGDRHLRRKLKALGTTWTQLKREVKREETMSSDVLHTGGC